MQKLHEKASETRFEILSNRYEGLKNKLVGLLRKIMKPSSQIPFIDLKSDLKLFRSLENQVMSLYTQSLVTKAPHYNS